MYIILKIFIIEFDFLPITQIKLFFYHAVLINLSWCQWNQDVLRIADTNLKPWPRHETHNTLCPPPNLAQNPAEKITSKAWHLLITHESGVSLSIFQLTCFLYSFHPYVSVFISEYTSCDVSLATLSKKYADEILQKSLLIMCHVP